MKKLSLVIASLFALYGCSSVENGGALSLGLDEDRVSIPVDYVEAQSRLQACIRQEIKNWDLKDSSFDGSHGFSVTMDDDLDESEFSVDFDFISDSLSSEGGLASAGVLGEGSGWILRLENGKIALHIRANGDDSWMKVIAGKDVESKKWNTVRLDHVDSLFAVSVNDEMVLAIEMNWKFSTSKGGDITIGFDVQNGRDTSYFCGKFGHLGYHKLRHKKNHESPDLDIAESSSSEEVEYSSSREHIFDSTGVDWIAKWEFNDPENAGKDFSGNGHDASIYEGSIDIEDGIAHFNGQSGLTILPTSDMKLKNFVVEARVKPTSFSGFNNILVTEPPGYGPDGWILRFENSQLVFLARDAAWNQDWDGLAYMDVTTDEWYQIRMEVQNDSLRMFVNGELVEQKFMKGDFSDLTYQWGLGCDAVNQAIHNRNFIGFIDYIRVGALAEGYKVPSVDVEPEIDFSKACSVDALMADDETLFFDGMDSVINEGTLVDGVCGLAVRLNDDEVGKTDISMDDSLEVGTVEFWFRPGEDFYDYSARTLLGNDEARIHFFMKEDTLIFQKNHADKHFFVKGNVGLKNGWNLIAGQWGDGYLSLWLNRTLVARVAHSEGYAPSLRGYAFGNQIVFGSKSGCCMEGVEQYSAMNTSGDYDQLRISKVARYEMPQEEDVVSELDSGLEDSEDFVEE